MKHLLWVSLLLFSRTASAEDTLCITGNYFKERSTRVIEPITRLTKDLPHDTEIEVEFLVDQITSASGAFTVTDEPFSEYREEIRVWARTEFLDAIKPGLTVRYSYEPDYQSLGLGGDLTVKLFDEMTTLRAYAEWQSDDISQREQPGFQEELSTVVVGLAATQVLRKDLVFGTSLETRILRGYQENPYRAETHPRERDRYTFGGWGAYRINASGTTLKMTYRYYVDDWELHGHTFDFEIVQQIIDGLDIAPRFRYHTQDGVFFENLSQNYVTQDPKLKPFNGRMYGGRISWTQRWLRGTFLDLFERSRLEPAYFYDHTDISYGPAHIAQITWFWPF